MSKIAPNVSALIGSTPLVRVNKLTEEIGSKATVLAKLEYFNPGGSVKDRAALYMIEEAEKQGILKPGAVIIEPTSGNTGVGLALVAAVKGYRLILTMPESMSMERRRLLQARGAQLVLTPASEGMKGAIAKAEELRDSTPGSVILQQFNNEANPSAHSATTALELINDTDGKIDVFVASVGTGGTITGTARVLKEKVPGVKVIAVEPEDSPVLSGGTPGPHKFQGIGAGFIPKIYDSSVVDEIRTANIQKAFTTARNLAAREGMLVGITSGAAMSIALELSTLPEYEGKTIVVVLPDTGERYLSTELFSFPE